MRAIRLCTALRTKRGCGVYDLVPRRTVGEPRSATPEFRLIELAVH
jgi:hypothetical protein